MGIRHNLKERTEKGEKIGGGYIVMRRHTTTGRVEVCPIGLPFEWPTREAAWQEASRLASLHPGKKFCVFAQTNEQWVMKPDEPAQQAAE